MKVSQEKEKKMNLFKLKLTKEGMDEVHMKILPSMSLKKEGQVVTYSDRFTLFNEKFQMTLIFPKRSSRNAQYKMEKGKHIDFRKKKEISKVVNPEDLPMIQDLPICEQNDMFMMENAHTMNISSRFKRKISKDLSGNYSTAIGFKFVNYSR